MTNPDGQGRPEPPLAATLSLGAPGTQALEAFVGDDVPGSGHPGFVLVSSNEVSVTWWRLVLRGSRAGWAAR